jgi:hypothetical protein
LSASEKPAEANAKQAASEGAETKNNIARKAFLRKLDPHIQNFTARHFGFRNWNLELLWSLVDEDSIERRSYLAHR